LQWIHTVNIRDITLRKEAERQILHARDEAIKASKMKSAFVSNMSHEIRTPLNGILGFAEILGFSPLKEEEKQYVQIIKSSGKHLLQLINMVLDFSKIEAGHVNLTEETFRLQEALQEVHEFLYLKCQEKSLRLELLLDPALPLKIISDPIRLKQVLLNLAQNAVKFTEQGEVQIGAKLLEPLRPERSALIHFFVRDTGIGIAPENLERIFQSFTQVDSDLSRQYEGSGLGLAIADRIIGMMGGKIQVESLPGRGSLFSFDLEIKIPQSLEEDRPFQTRMLSDQEKSESLILMAEDNEINQVALKTMLIHAGFRPILVDNGPAAISAAAEQDFDIILMDIHMPGMDGLRATERIRSQAQSKGKRQPVIIAVTADAFEEDRIRCLEAGMDDYMAKPVTFDGLKEKVQYWILKTNKE